MIDVARAWRDEDYYRRLSAEERSAVPANPAGIVDLRDELLNGVFGGSTSTIEDCTVPHFVCTRSACTIGVHC